MALARLSEINVSTEGVMGAKDFFEAKVPFQKRWRRRRRRSCVLAVTARGRGLSADAGGVSGQQV